MKRWVNVMAQVALGAGQVAAVANPLLGEREKVLVALMVAVFQLLVSALAHEFNPDGTSAKVAWEPPASGKER